MLDLEIGKVGELEDGGILDVESFDVELILAFEKQILIEFIVERTPAETVLEVVDQHHLDRTQVKPVEFVGLDLQIGIVLLIDALELIRTDFLNQCVIDAVHVLEEGGDVFGTDELVIVGLEQGH